MTWFFDTECYPNYWLLKGRPVGGPVTTFRLHAGERFSAAQIAEILALFDAHTVVSFNGRGYDQWTIARAVGGGTPADMKVVNDQIIVERLKPWTLGLDRWGPRDHIDIMEVCPGAGSQKAYAGRVHAKTMRDLPYDPALPLTPAQMVQIDAYCENDLDVLEHLWRECESMLQLREGLSARYGMDLRSKSDAQVAEAVLKKRCEQATGQRIYRPDTVGAQTLRYRMPDFIAYSTPELQHAQALIRDATFTLGDSGNILTPPSLEKLTINMGRSAYKVGIGGLHSQEKCVSYRSDEHTVLRDNDVASYYPNLILNSGEFPPALGATFRSEYQGILNERIAAKETQGRLKKAGDTASAEYVASKTTNEAGKLALNGTFGKTGSAYSILFAPSMLLQTTLTGQLSLLMLIEWHELYQIPVVSANTDGIVIACPRALVPTSQALIAEWERRTSLTMETVEYKSLHSRDVNSYFAVKSDGDVKRKGEYAKTSFVDKKSPDVEICSDAVARFLSDGTPIEWSIMTCRDIRKFVSVQTVTGGALKLWGESPLGDEKVRDMDGRLLAHGWVKAGRKWRRGELELDATSAFTATYPIPRPEYLGKVVRWYYSTRSPGHIVYAKRAAKVSLSYGAQPCMSLPDTLPDDIDYAWYIRKVQSILDDVGYRA